MEQLTEQTKRFDRSAIRAVAFDLDGTLLDTVGDLGTAANVTLHHFGLPGHPLEAYRNFVGNGLLTLYRRAAPAGTDEQTIIALPFYSRLWKETTKDGKVKLTSEAYGMRSAKENMIDAGAAFAWDDSTGTNYAEYTRDGVVYKMWLEDQKSLEEKMKTVSDSKTAGYAFWKLGLEDSSVWDMIIKYM